MPVALSVSKKTNWELKSFVKVPFCLVTCDELTVTSRLVLIFLINQVGYKPVSLSVIDRCLGIHRSTRIRAIQELKELGFLSGPDSHLILEDPQEVAVALKRKIRRDTAESYIIIDREEYVKLVEKRQEEKELAKELAPKRDFLQEATDAWNRYRPKDYQRIRRISAQVIKALDIHMRDLNVPAHKYDEFFSIIKSGVEKSDFWLNKNTNKTLQSITGVGTPTDRKRSNVYNLFNEGASSPAKPTDEEERADTIVYPADFRPLISEYEAAQHTYNEAYRDRTIDNDIDQYVIRTENALKEVGLDPAKFRLKYGMRTWPTDTPEPAVSRVIDWTFDDEYGYAL